MELHNIFQDGLSDYPELLTISEVQNILNVSKSTVLRMLNRNELTRLKFNVGTRISKAEVIKLVSMAEKRGRQWTAT